MNFCSVSCSRAAPPHPGRWWQHPDAHAVHRDGHATARGGRTRVERICKVPAPTRTHRRQKFHYLRIWIPFSRDLKGWEVVGTGWAPGVDTTNGVSAFIKTTTLLFGALLKPQRVNRPVLFPPLKQTRWGLGRWVKFEEKVEEGGERWSKPHVSTLTLHSLFELRTCLQTGSILLDLEGYSLPQIVGESCLGQMGHPDPVCDIPVNIEGGVPWLLYAVFFFLFSKKPSQSLFVTTTNSFSHLKK